MMPYCGGAPRRPTHLYLPLTVEQHRLVTVVMDTTPAGPWIWNSLPEDTQSRCWQHLVDTWNYIYSDNLTRILCRTVLFPLMGIEIGMEIIYFHSEK